MGIVTRITTGVFGWLFTLMLTGIIIGSVAAFMVFRHYAQDLPDYGQLAKYDPPTVTRLYAADGRLLAEYATEKRVFVPLNAIPKRVISAFLAAEDKNFYEHAGIDLMGIGRAVYTNILNYGHGRSMVGGSTITQQVVKNFLLSDEKSLERKVKEAILAMRISKVYSKDKILELYLNEIYLGMRSYGVAAAALNFYNKSLDELTIEEAALLAAMPKAPSSYDPRRNAQVAKQRRDWVISRMQEDGYITADEMKAAIATPIALQARGADDVARADFFSEEVRRWLQDQYGQNVLYEGGLVVKTTLDPGLQKIADAALRKALVAYDRRRGYRGPVKKLGGLSDWQKNLAVLARQDHHLVDGQYLAVVTAMDASKVTIGFVDGKTASIPFSLLKWTRRVLGDGVLGPEIRKPADLFSLGDVVIATPVLEENRKGFSAEQLKNTWELGQVPAVNGAMVVMDPHTGRVLAMSGGYAFGGTEFNRATQAKRQPGSSFKPFVYMAGLENGFTPSTILLDAPVEMSQGAGLPTWKPQNYHDEYLGPTTLRVGLEKSRNTMTVRLAQMIGIDRVLEMGKRLGVYDNPQRNFSIVLGASETTLLRLANAYSMIVNGGKQVAPALVERIDDRHGRTIYRRDNRVCTGCTVQVTQDEKPVAGDPPIPPDNRAQVIDPRIAYQMVSMMEGVVQRGTATRARSLNRPLAGKTGTTNNSMDTWFMGFSPDMVVGTFVGYDRPQTLGKKETGGSVALPAFIDFMKEALAKKPVVPFRVPRGIQLVKVDLHTGEAVDGEADGKTVIQEAFVTGPPIFIPGVSANTPLPWQTEGAAGAPQAEVVPENPLEPVPDEEDPNMPNPMIIMKENPAPPVAGTGGLY